jgi:cytoskeleton protein RodZ
MRERIDITTVESATKIRAKYLRALENEEWDQLPGPTFVRTFLRTYADYLGLDSKLLVEDYKQRFERPGPQDVLPFSTRSGGGRKPPRPPRAIPPWVPLGGLVVVILAALFVLGSLGDDEPEEREAVATPTPAATQTPRKEERKRDRPPAKPKVVELQIVPEAEVYVCLETAGGERLIAGEIISEPTDTYREKRMRVTFGNGLVTMRLGGRSVDVPDSDEPVGFELVAGKDPRSLGADAQPTCT